MIFEKLDPYQYAINAEYILRCLLPNSIPTITLQIMFHFPAAIFSVQLWKMLATNEEKHHFYFLVYFASLNRAIQFAEMW